MRGRLGRLWCGLWGDMRCVTGRGELVGREGERKRKGGGWLHALLVGLEAEAEGMVVLAISSPVRASWGGADGMMGIRRTLWVLERKEVWEKQRRIDRKDVTHRESRHQKRVC